MLSIIPTSVTAGPVIAAWIPHGSLERLVVQRRAQVRTEYERVRSIGCCLMVPNKPC